MTKIWTHQERKHMDGKQASEKISLENCQLKQDTTTQHMVNVQSTTPKAGWGCGPPGAPTHCGQECKVTTSHSNNKSWRGESWFEHFAYFMYSSFKLVVIRNDIHFILNVTESGLKKEIMSGENKLDDENFQNLMKYQSPYLRSSRGY